MNSSVRNYGMRLKSIATSLLGLALCVPAWTQDKPKLAELVFGGDIILVDGFWERVILHRGCSK
jgi:hypothetical protein